ncbi:MAG: hypothetical protein ACKOAD_04460 [Gammaproteobacteria bacterium]
MSNQTKPKKSKDNQEAACLSCKRPILMAYWDYELSSYIYLRDEAICDVCLESEEPEQAVSSSKHFQPELV